MPPEVGLCAHAQRTPNAPSPPAAPPHPTQDISNRRGYGVELAERPRATAQDALRPRSFAGTALGEAELGVIQAAAQQAGLVAAAAVGVASAGAVIAANAISPRFRGALGLSGKLALVVTPTSGAFFLRSHLTLASARADPDGFLRGTRAAQQDGAAAAPRRGALSVGQRVANFVYDHPFKVIVGIALPTYAAIFRRESTQPATAGMLLSQRLIHTRVYGQGVVVLTTLGVMGFVETMKPEGRYRLQGGVVVRGESSSSTRYVYPDGSRAVAAAGEEEEEEEEDGGGGPRLELLAPLVYVPLMPLLWVGLRGKLPRERMHQLIGGTIAMGLAHSGYIMFSDSSTRLGS